MLNKKKKGYWTKAMRVLLEILVLYMCAMGEIAKVDCGCALVKIEECMRMVASVHSEESVNLHTG